MSEQAAFDIVRRLDGLSLAPGMLALVALGQAGFAIKAGATTVYIDPYLSDAIETKGGSARAVPLVANPMAINHAAAVLCTHEHADHTDPLTVLPIAHASTGAAIFASPQGRDLLVEAGLPAERIVVPRLGEAHSVGDFSITAIPAAHYEYEVDAEGHARWMGFVLEAGGVTLYHAGDTIMVPPLLEALEGRRIDLALLPINGRDYFREQRGIVGNLNVREVAELCLRLQPNVLIPVHNDLFAGNRINPAEMVLELERVAPRQRFHFLRAGELYVYAG